MVKFALLDATRYGRLLITHYLWQTTSSSGAKIAVFVFPQ